MKMTIKPNEESFLPALDRAIKDARQLLQSSSGNALSERIGERKEDLRELLQLGASLTLLHKLMVAQNLECSRSQLSKALGQMGLWPTRKGTRKKRSKDTPVEDSATQTPDGVAA